MNLQAGDNFSTKLGSNGSTTQYKVITSLGSAGSTTGTDLQGINGNLSGNYVLGADIDASSTSSWNSGAGFNPLGNSTTQYTGIFDGLGHSISNLTIDRPSTSYVGLFGSISNTASISNVGLAGGTVRGYSYVGGLVGNNYGTITQSYATGSVSGNTYVGGLVGNNAGGTITQSYATGSVSGNTYVGGLVGLNSLGTITQSYSTGSVSGTSSVGGLLGGISFGGTITDSYWDTQTSGQSTSAGGTGLTTAQFQSGSLPSGFSAAAWGTGNGLYPYLTTFYPNGVQAFSGIAYKDAGATLAASGANGAVTVSLDGNGGLLGRATTGANGYYYIAVANDTLSNGTTLLASTPTNGSLSTNAATLATSNGTAAQTNVNLYGNTLAVATSATLLSQAPVLTDARANATTTAGTDSAAASIVAATTGVGYLATGVSFSIDTATTIGSGSSLFVATAADAPLTVDAAVTVADKGSLTLASGDALRINAPITAKGAASVSLAYNTSSPTNLSFASGAGLTYLGANGSTVTRSAGGLLNINSNAYTLLYAMDDIDGIDGIAAGGRINTQAAGLSGNYAIANNLDATGTTYTAALVGTGNGTFSGTLEGLGHSITGLTIKAPSTSYVGLVGRSSGTLRDIGLIGGSVSGNSYIGGLVGENGGTITQAYSTGSVSGSSIAGGLLAGGNVGGLVGLNYGTITQSYATGSVSGTSNIGGLVGLNNYKIVSGAFKNGTITQSYATGSVSGTSNIGGLTGENDGIITQSYSSGRVSGSSYVGGLVGGIPSGTTTNSFWNTETSGLTTSAGGTGLTTAQMQTSSTFSNAGWDISNVGGDGSVWRIYEGQTSPLLRSFLTTVDLGTVTTTYDGSTQTASSATASLDSSKVLGSAASGQNAGTYTSGYYSGQQGYDFVGGDLTINKANATVTANSATVTYNGATQSVSGFTASGLVGGETSSVLTGVSASGSGKNAGSYTSSASGTAQNYTLTFVDGQLLINKANATVTANSATVTYNGANQTVSGFTTTGLVGGEDNSVLTNVSASGASGKDAGSYANTASGTAQNYNLTFVNGQLLINKANATVTANSATVTYNGATQSVSGFTATGLVGGETSSVLTGVSASGSGKNAGSYTSSASGTAQNYTLTFVDGQLLINKANATVTANSATVTYNGATQSVSGFTTTGLVGGETNAVLNVAATGASGKDAGTYTSTVSGTAQNYNLTFVNGQLKINSAPVSSASKMLSCLKVGTTSYVSCF